MAKRHIAIRPQTSRSRLYDYLRLITGAVMTALAALTLVEAPIWPLLMLRIGVTELGYALALPALALALGAERSPAGRAARALSLLAAGLSLAPALQAASIARRLPEQLDAAFGAAPPRGLPGAPPRPAPLVASDLLRGITSPPVRRCRVPYVVRDGRVLYLDLYLPPTDDQRPTTNDLLGEPRTAEPQNRRTENQNTEQRTTNKATTNYGLRTTDRARNLVRNSSFSILNSQLAPCVVVVHGGSWVRGDSTQLAGLNRYLAARGYVVAAINYRLLPDHPFPAGCDDLLAAIDYLKTNARAIGFDPQRIVLLGRSAGGQLALLVAYTAGDPAIRGAIGIYPAIDLAYAYHHPSDPRLLDGRAVLRAYLGGTPDQVPEAYAVASPTSFVGPNTPPTLLIHGGGDEMVSPTQSRRLATRLTQAGRPHLLLQLPWATHGYDAHLSGPSGQLSTYAIERFLAAVI